MTRSTDRSPAQTQTTFHILLALANGPLHGYGVMQQVAEAGGKMGPGTIYGALHRMQEGGWVERAGSERARGPGKLRHRYGLTPDGWEVLRTEARRVVHAADLVRARAVLIDDTEVAS